MPGNIINLSVADIEKWPPANYIDPETKDWMPGYAGVFYGFATVCVGMRLLSRSKNRASGFGIDDAFLMASWVFLSMFTVLLILASEKYMAKRRIWDIPINLFEPLARTTWLAEMAFLLTGCSLRTSVLLFYRRLVDGTCTRPWIIAVWTAIAFNFAWSLAFVLALIFNCTPTEAYWKSFDFSYTEKHHCTNTIVNNILAGILAVISDFYAVALPCIMTRRLRLPFGQKIALYAVFAMGLVIVVASSVRTYYLWKVGYQSDVSTYIFNVFVWSQAELTLGIVCASGPSLRVIFRRMIAQLLSKSKRSAGMSGAASRIIQRNEDASHDGDADPAHQRATPDPYALYSLKQTQSIDERTLFGSDGAYDDRKDSKSSSLGLVERPSIGALEAAGKFDHIHTVDDLFKH